MLHFLCLHFDASVETGDCQRKKKQNKTKKNKKKNKQTNKQTNDNASNHCYVSVLIRY